MRWPGAPSSPRTGVPGGRSLSDGVEPSSRLGWDARCANPQMLPSPVRLVLDTSVIVAAFRSPTGASRYLLRLVPQDRFNLLPRPLVSLNTKQSSNALSTLTFTDSQTRRLTDSSCFLLGTSTSRRSTTNGVLNSTTRMMNWSWRPPLVAKPTQSLPTTSPISFPPRIILVFTYSPQEVS
jgi:hypothetical protein